MCVCCGCSEPLFQGEGNTKRKNTTGRHIILLGLLSKRGLMCNTARSLHVGIKVSKPPPPRVCVFHSLVCPTAFRQQIPARRERRTPRCPARRTSPRSTSGRSRSWRWRWRKVSVCVIEEASKMKQQTEEAFNHRFSLFQPFV